MSPTGVTYYESGAEFVVLFAITFPSPTGVTYYEYCVCDWNDLIDAYGFHPQQGLLIMNNGLQGRMQYRG